MYISEMNIENFRKYNKLSVEFNKDLNIIVGENNSGKTAIIDAIRLVLGVQGNEYYRIEREDFYYGVEGYTNEFKIQITIEGIGDTEGGKFLEYISYKNKKDEQNNIEYIPYIVIKLIAKYEKNKIFYDVYVGDFEENIGIRMPGELKEYLRVVFLKPLRDAENQMTAKRNSRLSQVLMNFDSEILNESDENKLVKIMENANDEITKATDEIKITPMGEQEQKTIMELINDFVSYMNAGLDTSLSKLKIKDNSLKEILERMSVEFDSRKEGLGIENLLFTAIEFLLLKNSSYIGLKTVLIEEIEAHLHPQTQLNLINYLIKNYAQKENGQIILTTHSPNITSKVNIKNILICKDNQLYNMGNKYTELEKGDYKFLSRFLDVTKSNLFFAKSLIFVEGDAEALLVPILAKIILGSTLESKGISIINVGNTAFLRYSKIFQRKKDMNQMNIKIAIITDLDVKRRLKDGEYESDLELQKRELAEIIRKEELYNYGSIKTFVSPKRTLEYCIALTKYKKMLLQSICEAEKEQNSNKNPDDIEKIKECNDSADMFLEQYINLGEDELATKIYEEKLLKSNKVNTKSVSKAITAQILANKIENEYNSLKNMEQKNEYREKLLEQDKIKYIIEAINYVGN